MHFDFVFKLRVYIVTKIIIILLAGWKDSTAKLTIQLMSATQHFRERVKLRNHISLDRYIYCHFQIHIHNVKTVWRIILENKLTNCLLTWFQKLQVLPISQRFMDSIAFFS